MKNLVLTIPFIKEVRKMRKAMEENLIDLMKQHGVSEVYCDEIENVCPPIIHNGICEDDVYMLDTIRLISRSDYECILLGGGNEYCNGEVYANQMDIELLVEVYDWIISYKDKLFVKK